MTTAIEVEQFGKLLGVLFDRVNETIENSIQQTESAGVDLEIEAGREIALAIEGVKNRYKESLDYTLDRVSVEAKKAFNQLDTMVQSFEKMERDELDDLKSRAQQLANTLPFSKKEPQLTRVEPQYLVLGKTASVVVRFVGNFVWSGKKGFEPSLKMQDLDCRLIQSTTQKLEFEIPRSLMKGQAYQYGYQLGHLKVPYDDGWVWSHRNEFDYKVGLGLLPLSPGKITVEYATKRQETVTRNQDSRYFKENGNDYYPQHWHTKVETVYPAKGWQIDVTKAASLKVFHEHGNHQQSIESVTPTAITCKVGLYCKSGSDIGIFHFCVNYYECQEKTVVDIREEEVKLQWGDSAVLTPKEGETVSRVRFSAFDGSKQEFSGPDQSRLYLKVGAEADGSWKIWAEAPKE